VFATAGADDEDFHRRDSSTKMRGAEAILKSFSNFPGMCALVFYVLRFTFHVSEWER
jgi:hypothetical protein